MNFLTDAAHAVANKASDAAHAVGGAACSMGVTKLCGPVISFGKGKVEEAAAKVTGIPEAAKKCILDGLEKILKKKCAAVCDRRELLSMPTPCAVLEEVVPDVLTIAATCIHQNSAGVAALASAAQVDAMVKKVEGAINGAVKSHCSRRRMNFLTDAAHAVANKASDAAHAVGGAACSMGVTKLCGPVISFGKGKVEEAANKVTGIPAAAKKCILDGLATILNKKCAAVCN